MSGRNIGLGFVGLLIVGIILRIVYPTSTPVVEVAPEPLFFIGGFEFTNSMLTTLVLDVVLILLAVAATSKMNMVPRGLQNAMEATIEALYNLFKGVNAEHVGRTFPLVATIFLFVIIANLSGLLPGVGSIGICHASEEYEGEEASQDVRLALSVPNDTLREAQQAAPLAAEEGKMVYTGCPPDEQHIFPFWRPPSTDLAFTLAITIIAWIWIQYLAFAALGIGYLGKYFNFKEGPIMFVVGLLEFISLLARIPAFMFRLFGNIFAGEVLIIVMLFLIPLGLPTPIYLFEVFVAFIQAFIFAVLVMAFITIDTTPHSDEHH